MEAALADAAPVVLLRQHSLALMVVPLDLAGDDRVAGQIALGVVVLMSLLRLPAKKPLLGDA